jgi:acetyl-CoA C-acetyltransferase
MASIKQKPVIIAAVRTPVGRYMGALKSVEAYDLAALVLNEVVKRANIEPGMVDEVIMGQSYQSGEYVNIARMSLLKAGWPESV